MISWAWQADCLAKSNPQQLGYTSEFETHPMNYNGMRFALVGISVSGTPMDRQSSFPPQLKPDTDIHVHGLDSLTSSIFSHSIMPSLYRQAAV
jgi:hypothetical protein